MQQRDDLGRNRCPSLQKEEAGGLRWGPQMAQVGSTDGGPQQWEEWVRGAFVWPPSPTAKTLGRVLRT